MKNVLSTLAFLAVLGIGIGIVCFYGGFFNKGEVKVDFDEVAVEIEQELGKPFLKALTERDVNKLKSFMRGDFGAALPGLPGWVTENKQPFEVQKRATAEDEHESTSDLDEFLGVLLDQTFGIEIGQAEFSILEVVDYWRGAWTCRMLLVVTGVDEDSHVRTYQSEHEIYVKMNEDIPGSTPSILWWQFESELIRKSSSPIMKELGVSLGEPDDVSQQPKFALDVADFDLDEDLDIVLLLEDGRQVLFVFTDGKYENVSEATGLKSFVAKPDGAISVAWLDVDKDGYPDLISGSNLYRNEQGKAFVEIDSQSELKLDGEALSAYRRRNQK